METYYYFQVYEYVGTHQAGQSFDQATEFRKEDFGNSYPRTFEAAENYFWERYYGMETATYIHPFAGPEEFVLGENSDSQVLLKLIQVNPATSDGFFEEEHYPFIIKGGDDEQERKEGEELLYELIGKPKNKEYKIGW
jgi:hypothetical protein